jgi:ribonucleoside-diphosphate reductase alpha chain
MKKEGISCEDCVVNPTSTSVFTFPMKAPKNALVSEDVTPLQHLELWRVYKEHWADHNVSITVNYTDDTFLDIGQWVWDKWETIQGLSFLPKTDHVYNQAPFETITEEEYEELENTIPNVDWSLLKEHEDNTKSTQTLACTGSACEIVDITEEVLNGN